MPDVAATRIAQRRAALEASKRVARMAGVSAETMLALGALHTLRVEPAAHQRVLLIGQGYIKRRLTQLGRPFHTVTDAGLDALRECNPHLKIVAAVGRQ